MDGSVTGKAHCNGAVMYGMDDGIDGMKHLNGIVVSYILVSYIYLTNII